MSADEILSFNTKLLFILLTITAIIDYIRRRSPQRRDFALLASALGYPLAITLIRTFYPLKSSFLDLSGAFALFAQPYFLFRLLQYFRPSRGRMSILILAGFALSCVLLMTQLVANRALTITLIFAYCSAAEAYSTWGFYQRMRSAVGTLRRRLRIITISSAVFTLAFVINAAKAQIPSLGISPIAQAAAAISAILFYLAFIPPRWLRRAWQMEELRDYMSQARIAPASDTFTADRFQQLSQGAKQATNARASGVLKFDESGHRWSVLATSDQSLFSGLISHGQWLLDRAWQQRSASYTLVKAIPDIDQRRQLQQLAMQSWLMTPIQSQERIWGLLVVALKDRALFIEDDLNVLYLLAQECALLLDNHRLIEELQHYSEQLEHKVEERTVALQRSNEELRHYAYVASHDLQEPLRMVISYLELIERRFPDKLDTEAREFIAFAVEGALRMKSLITDLLMYSRLETRSHTFRWIDTQQVLDKTKQMLKVAIEETDAKITNDEMPQVLADEELILQIFQNLIANAIKYRSTRQPEIHIGATCKDRLWIFSVKDNGIGIEQKFLERIFIMFQRLHTREKYPGTGIGLAICKKAVELHEGRIWAESEFGTGTTFYFTIPLREENDVRLSNAS
jgi:signal transduction histidine kinase